MFATSLHDLRHPLSQLTPLCTELKTELLKTDASGDVERSLTRMEGIIHRANHRAERILTNVKILLGVAPLNCSRHTLADLEQHLRDSLTGVATLFGVGVSYRTSKGDTGVVVDAELLVQAIENIALNAFEVSPSDGAVEIELQCRDAELLIHVRDQGPGIPDQLSAKAFHAFCSKETGKKSVGLGLGLYLVAEVARLHGGRTLLENCKNGGACCSIILPANGGN